MAGIKYSSSTSSGQAYGDKFLVSIMSELKQAYTSEQ